MKSEFDIEEYSFGQTTLEQVFIEFAKLQEAANQDKGGGGDGGGEENEAAAEAEARKRMRLLRQSSDAQAQGTVAVLNGMPSNSAVEVTNL